MLYRLLRDLRPEDYCLLSRENYDSYTSEQISSSRLPARYYHLPPGFRLTRPSRFGLGVIRELGNILLQVPQRAMSVARILKRERCRAIVACSGDLFDIPAGYLASRWARVPFYAYVFDDYTYQWIEGLHRYFARWAESIVLKGAAGVIVPNEFLRDEYRRRYQLAPTVIHNPCEVSEIDERDQPPWPADEDEIKIVYTGAIYHAHYDAFRNLIAAIQQLDQPNVKLHLYTAQPLEELNRGNISGPIVYHNHLAPSHVWEVQRQADILFLPLAFNSPIPEVIKTSAPGKMGEYLASGRPVLVHAPADSYVSWYFKEHACGMVVDWNEPAGLAQAIRRILDDAALRQQLRKNAQARARTDFSLMVAQAEFVKLFQSVEG